MAGKKISTEIINNANKIYVVNENFFLNCKFYNIIISLRLFLKKIN